MDRVDCIVVGAGVVGLAIARRIAAAGREVIVLESADSVGTGISSRNSEVIHAGIYYPGGSLKARLCVEGNRRLYRYCAHFGVDSKRIGKFIVATSPAQLATLSELHDAARQNGTEELQPISKAMARTELPEITCEGALFSPSTGILDAHGFMLSLLGEIERWGGAVALRTPFISVTASGERFIVETGGASPLTLECNSLVNAAGLDAVCVARSIVGLDALHVPELYLAQGAYFELAGSTSPFRHLIYPIPEPGGLGIHATLDLSGRVRFGPDVQWINAPSYAIEPERVARFYSAIRKYWPSLPDAALVPAYAGVRPKISGPGAPTRDFLIDGPARHGISGLVNLFGVESPGLTASLAISEHVAELLGLASDLPAEYVQ